MDSVFTFMSTLIQWMDSTPWIDKYFYYGMCENTTPLGSCNLDIFLLYQVL